MKKLQMCSIPISWVFACVGELKLTHIRTLKFTLVLLLTGVVSGTLPIVSYADTVTEVLSLSDIQRNESFFLKNFTYEGPFQQDVFTVPRRKILVIEQVSIHAIAAFSDPLSPADFNAGLSTDSVSIGILFGATQFVQQDKPVPGLPARTAGTTSQLVKFYVLPGQTLRLFVGIGGHPEINVGADIGIVGRFIDSY